jgi:polyphosphate kinase
MQQSIRMGGFGSVVQVAVYESMPDHIRRLLVENLRINSSDLFVHSKPLGSRERPALRAHGYRKLQRREIDRLRRSQPVHMRRGNWR